MREEYKYNYMYSYIYFYEIYILIYMYLYLYFSLSIHTHSIDNAGYELITDLILGYILLKYKCCVTVSYHVKAYPTYVSDASKEDFMLTLEEVSV